MTYAQLRGDVLTAVKSLLALGVERGDRIALWAPNSHRWVVAALAAAAAGRPSCLSTPGTRGGGTQAPRHERRTAAARTQRLPRQRLPGHARCHRRSGRTAPATARPDACGGSGR
ncbi:AMP-binding protein [Streptomyces sp. M10(2022)]